MEAIIAVGHSQAGQSTFIGQILVAGQVERPSVGDGSGISVTKGFRLWPTEVGFVLECPGIDNTQIDISAEAFGHMVSVVVATANVASLKIMIFESLTNDSLQLRATAAFIAMALGKDVLKSAIVVASKVALCPTRDKRISKIQQIIPLLDLAKLFVWHTEDMKHGGQLDMLRSALDEIIAAPTADITYLHEKKRHRAQEMCCHAPLHKFHFEPKDSMSQQLSKKVRITIEHPLPVYHFYQASLKAIGAEVLASFRCEDEHNRTINETSEECTIDACIDDSLVLDYLKRDFKFRIPKVDLQQLRIRKVLQDYILFLPSTHMIYKPGGSRVLNSEYSRWPDSNDLSITMQPKSNQIIIAIRDGLWDLVTESLIVDGNVFEFSLRKSTFVETYYPTTFSGELCCPSEVSTCINQRQTDKCVSEPGMTHGICKTLNVNEIDAHSAASAPARSTWPRCFTPDTLFNQVSTRGDATSIVTPIKARDVQVGQKLSSPNSDGYAIVKSVRFHQSCERDLVRIFFSSGSTIEISADHRLALRLTQSGRSRDLNATAHECVNLCHQGHQLHVIGDDAREQQIETAVACPRSQVAVVEICLLEDQPVYAVTRPAMFAMLGSQFHRAFEIPEGYVSVRMKDNKKGETVMDVVGTAFEHLGLPLDDILETQMPHIVFIPETVAQRVQGLIQEGMKATRPALGCGRGSRAPRIVFDFHDESHYHPARSLAEAR